MRCGPVCGLSAREEREFLKTYRRDSSLPCSESQEFLRRFEPFIIRTSVNLSLDTSSQAELYQEGVVGAYEALGTFGPRCGVRLSTHVRNSIKWRILKARRRERRRALSYGGSGNPRLTSLDAVATARSEEGEERPSIELADTSWDACPRASAERGLLARSLACAMERLTQKQREAIDLVWLQDVRPSEAAVQMGVSRPRATQLVSAGLERLRGELSPEWAA